MEAAAAGFHASEDRVSVVTEWVCFSGVYFWGAIAGTTIEEVLIESCALACPVSQSKVDGSTRPWMAVAVAVKWESVRMCMMVGGWGHPAEKVN